jgi:uncharacterized membrane protein YhiD involved in acid resistance
VQWLLIEPEALERERRRLATASGRASAAEHCGSVTTILTGVGFIGAGAIMRRDEGVITIEWTRK